MSPSHRRGTFVGFFVLIACQLLGEGLRQVFRLPVPGPVIGMFILAAALVLRNRQAPAPRAASDMSLERTANLLIGNMGLLFVPAGVGVIAEEALIRGAWLPLTVGLVGSTVASLVVTGIVMEAVGKLSAGQR